jgi:NAD+ diphosphatase
MRCPVDGLSNYPRVAPAVIVLVERDDTALLARSGRWEVPMYSTLAGFVEPGETIEDTVSREIREEVGVDVTDVRYVASQPWPFPHSLMLGFTARWAGGDITVDGDEIADANWYRASALPMIPPPPSIARRLIDDWLARSS